MGSGRRGGMEYEWEWDPLTAERGESGWILANAAHLCSSTDLSRDCIGSIADGVREHYHSRRSFFASLHNIGILVVGIQGYRPDVTVNPSRAQPQGRVRPPSQRTKLYTVQDHHTTSSLNHPHAARTVHAQAIGPAQSLQLRRQDLPRDLVPSRAGRGKDLTASGKEPAVTVSKGHSTMS